MRKSVKSMLSPLGKAVALACSLAMCVSLAACSSSSSDSKSSSDSSDKKGQIAGVTAKGKLGEKPTISFNTPMTVSDGSYVVLQKGDGDVIEEGARVCAQGIALNVKDGTELMATWIPRPSPRPTTTRSRVPRSTPRSALASTLRIRPDTLTFWR